MDPQPTPNFPSGKLHPLRSLFEEHCFRYGKTRLVIFSNFSPDDTRGLVSDAMRYGGCKNGSEAADWIHEKQDKGEDRRIYSSNQFNKL